MPYIYKYVNRETDDVEYVGISSTEEAFYKRIASHERDQWYEPFKYDIYYAITDSRCDAEALEGHFIAHYGSYKFHNIAKTRWGECSFAPSVEWIKFDPDKTIKSQADCYKKTKEIRSKLWSFDDEISKLQHQINVIFNELIDIEDATKKARRSSIRQWFNDSLGISYEYDEKAYKASKCLLFEMFNKWSEDNSPEWTFDDEDDFWDAMHDVPEFAYHFRGDYMYALVTRQQIEEGTRKAVDLLYSDILKEAQ